MTETKSMAYAAWTQECRSMMQLPLTGGCLCGAIRYEIAEPPFAVYTCHCTDCQRITSSAFSIGMVVPAEAVTCRGRHELWRAGLIADASNVG
jgi:hypothetical protein